MDLGSELEATVVDMNFVKPLDTLRILEVARKHKLIVTLEENALKGGAGSAVSEFLAEVDQKISILNLGLPDEFINHGSKEHQLMKTGLIKTEILESIRKRLNQD